MPLRHKVECNNFLNGSFRIRLTYLTKIVINLIYTNFSSHANIRVKILSIYRYRVRSAEKESKKFSITSIFLTFFRNKLSFPLKTIIFFPRPVQLSSACPHRTCLINIYTERYEMCLPQPPKRLKQRSARRCAFV